MQRFNLAGKVAVVTGGNGGIGAGIARGLLECGATIVIAARNVAKNDAAVAELGKLGPPVAGFVIDVAAEEQCHDLVRETVRRHGRLDILVNNAGGGIPKPPEELTVAETAYGPAKAGIVQLGENCASAWAKDNIQVNTILPGYIDTAMTKPMQANAEFHARAMARTAAGRLGTPDDLAGIAAFLASSASDFVTGADIAVDGGLLWGA